MGPQDAGRRRGLVSLKPGSATPLGEPFDFFWQVAALTKCDGNWTQQARYEELTGQPFSDWKHRGSAL